MLLRPIHPLDAFLVTVPILGALSVAVFLTVLDFFELAALFFLVWAFTYLGVMVTARIWVTHKWFWSNRVSNAIRPSLLLGAFGLVISVVISNLVAMLICLLPSALLFGLWAGRLLAGRVIDAGESDHLMLRNARPALVSALTERVGASSGYWRNEGKWVQGLSAYNAASYCTLGTPHAVTLEAIWLTQFQRRRISKREFQGEFGGTRLTWSGASDTPGLSWEAPSRQVLWGPAGSGKSVLLSRMIESLVAHDVSVVLFDGKGGESDAEALRAGLSASSEVRIWPSDGGLSFLANLSSEQISDLLIYVADVLADGGVSNAYYDREAQRGLMAVAALKPSTLAEAVEWCQRPPALRDPVSEHVHEALSVLTERAHQQTVGEVAAGVLRLAAARLGDRDNASTPPIRLVPGLTVLSAPATDAGGLAALALTLRRVQQLVSERSGSDHIQPVQIIIDDGAVMLESPTIMATVAALAAQGRGAHIGMTIALQSRAQIAPEIAQTLETNAQAVWVGGGSEAPQIVEAVGGNRDVSEASRGGNLGDASSTRLQTALGVDPAIAEILPTWSWVVKKRELPHWMLAVVPPLKSGDGTNFYGQIRTWGTPQQSMSQKLWKKLLNRIDL